MFLKKGDRNNTQWIKQSIQLANEKAQVILSNIVPCNDAWI